MLKNELILPIILTATMLIILFGKGYVLKKEGSIDTSNQETHVIKKSDFQLKIIPFKYSSDEFQAGMNILIYGHPDMHEVKETFEHLRRIGINSVAINFPFYQADFQANEVTTSETDTPTIAELRDIILAAHQLRLSVMIRPIMDERVFIASNSWRGEIQPTDPDAWFDSYETMILTYAKLAEATKAESLNIGTELNSMQKQYEERWLRLIENVRRVYNGDVLYSFNYDTVNDIDSIGFVQSLDYVGIDAYFPLDLPDDATSDMLVREWERHIHTMNKTLQQHRVLITEVGMIPVTGAYRTPYAWRIPHKKYDPQAQANYYEAAFEAWKQRVDGIYWWCVIPGENRKNISFSPLHLPAEEVIKKHFLNYANE